MGAQDTRPHLQSLQPLTSGTWITGLVRGGGRRTSPDNFNNCELSSPAAWMAVEVRDCEEEEGAVLLLILWKQQRSSFGRAESD